MFDLVMILISGYYLLVVEVVEMLKCELLLLVNFIMFNLLEVVVLVGMM